LAFSQFSAGCLQSLELWYNANQGVTYTGSGVTAWNDHEVVNSYTYNLKNGGATSTYPSYVADGINGYPVIAFGADDYLICTEEASAASGSGVISSDITLSQRQTSIYVVCKVNSGKSLLSYSKGGDRMVLESDAFYWAGRKNTANRIDFSTAIGSTYEVRQINLIDPGIPPFQITYENYKNGALVNSKQILAPSTIGSIGDTLVIGKRFGSDLEGSIAEVLWFQDAHNGSSNAKRRRITTYLSLKYGISQDGATRSYTSKSADVLWDYTVCNNSTYNNRITGIFNESCFGLEHKKSKNQSSDAIVTGALGNNFSSPSSFVKNKQYFLWGDDNGALTFNETADVPTGGYTRLNRRWKVNEFLNGSTIGDVTFEFDLSSTGIPTNIAESDLIILIDRNKDGSFSDETVVGGGVISPNSGSWNQSTRVGQFTADLNSCEIFTFAFKTTALPVTWLSFNAEKDNNSVSVSWSTGLEINNSHFVIERSVDGDTWNEIGQISGKGDFNGVSDYNFNDYYPSEGVNYYRVKQVDYDGMVSYSLVKSVVFMTNVLASSSVYPNPANEFVTIDIPFNNADVNYSIIDLSGNIVDQGVVSSDKNILNVQHLNKGVYMIFLSNFAVNQTHRLIVN
jgi:hypothetical protein